MGDTYFVGESVTITDGPFATFTGTINSINSVYNYFKEKRAGHISIVSSVAGYRGLPAGGAYCASKAALTNYAESLYLDMKRFNVRVSVVSPGRGN